MERVIYSFEEQEKKFMVNVYSWMFAALMVTGFVAFYISSQPQLMNIVLSTRGLLLGIFIAEIVLVMALSAMINRISSFVAIVMFMLYSVLNGVTFSLLFLIYTGDSIALTFFVCGGIFGVMSLYGYVTKTDLSSLKNIFFMALIGLILASVVNMFLNSSTLYWITSYIGVLLFSALTAYDTQKLKNMGASYYDGMDGYKKVSIYGALTLYLDFINLFLYLLRFFGKKR